MEYLWELSLVLIGAIASKNSFRSILKKIRLERLDSEFLISTKKIKDWVDHGFLKKSADIPNGYILAQGAS